MADDERIAFFQPRETANANFARAAITDEPQSPAAAATKPKAAAPKRPAVPAKPNAAANRGPAGRMQAGLATALKQDPDWKEF